MSFAKKSTENILSLLNVNNKIRLQYVSTVGVNGRKVSGLKEEQVKESREFFNTYEKSKAASEDLVFKAIADEKKIIIHRPSMVVGESISGKIIHFQVFYFLLRLASGEFTKGVLPPLLHRKIDTIPCDFVAKIIVESMSRPDLDGKVVHLCSGPNDSFTIQHMVEIMQKQTPLYGQKIVPIKTFSLLSYFAKLFPKRSKWRVRLELLPQFLAYANQDQIFFNENSKSYFSHIIWPQPSCYLPVVIKYFLEARKERVQ